MLLPRITKPSFEIWDQNSVIIGLKFPMTRQEVRTKLDPEGKFFKEEVNPPDKFSQDFWAFQLKRSNLYDPFCEFANQKFEVEYVEKDITHIFPKRRS